MNSYTPTLTPSRQSRASRRRQSRVEKFAFPKFFKFVKAAGQASRKRINFGFTRGSFEMSFQVGPNSLSSFPPPFLTLYPRGLRKIITLWRRHTARSPEWDASRRRKRSRQRGSEREGKRGMSVSWGERIGTKIVFSPANGEKLIPSAHPQPGAAPLWNGQLLCSSW